MRIKGKALSFMTLLLIIPLCYAHVCNDVLPGGSQYKDGCEPIIITVPGGASQNGNQVSLTINVENRQTPYSPATSCGNPWSGSLSNVRVNSVTSIPSCSACFSMSVNPTSATIPINSNQNYNTVVTISGSATPGVYTLRFEIRPGSYASRYVEVSGVVVEESSSSPCNLPWGGTISHGQSVTAYQSSSVPCGSSCSSQTRTCNNGVLSGSYTHQSCSVESCDSSCSLPWGGTVSHGQSVTAYQNNSVPCGSTCTSQTRTCNNGMLSGSYTHQACYVEECCMPETNTEFCNRHGKECGNYTATDNCDDARTANCGTCPAGQTCNNGQCTCVSNCSGKDCGDNGCGGSCGTCSSYVAANRTACYDEGHCINGTCRYSANSINPLGTCCEPSFIISSGTCYQLNTPNSTKCSSTQSCQSSCTCALNTCNNYTTQSACNARNDCEWCPLSSSCLASSLVSCTNNSVCYSNNTICTGSCTFSLCLGTESSCGCEHGVCSPCPEGRICEGNICIATACTPRWDCSDWGACASNGQRSRTCTDLNGCSSLEGMPATIEQCLYEHDAVSGVDVTGERLETEYYDDFLISGEEGEKVKAEARMKPPLVAAGLIFIILIAILSFIFLIKKKATPQDSNIQGRYSEPRLNETGPMLSEPSQEEPQSYSGPLSPQELKAIDYVRKCLDNGIPVDEVRENLIRAGWSPAMADEIINRLNQ